MGTSQLSTRTSEHPAAGSGGGVVVRALPFVGDDAVLVTAVRAGNRAAIAALYDRYEAHVMRTLVRVLGADRELADIHHDVFVRALGSIDELRDPGALRAWLTSIAIFTARTCILRRSRRFWLRLLPWYEVPEVEAPLPSSEVTEALRATYTILDGLPVDERIPFALRFVGGMELTEIAEACGVSLATIKRRLARAEAHFTEQAREHPALSDWLEGSARWGAPKKR
ncbi:RNA polymerase sigma factor [Polyangium mundeleinium]|uniref:RNA polymerase sigma factor n=1 Tax=Polyangium mundeleinium TaxID=2995306 RepID=A0ABT5EGS9_9BACT|nr:RNA polymerase sigma factor [Polyangium mundeleinium]MDC0740519.1 RNA polymerase sigma factor [Polyangium mundeleinium]